MEHKTIDIDQEIIQGPQRLDFYLANHDQMEKYSRNSIQKLIKEGNVTVDDEIITLPKTKIIDQKVINIVTPEPVAPLPLPQKMPLDIVYEDNDIIVINKPIGLVVHPGSGNHDQTLVNGLLHHCHDSLSGINGVLRPGIVHRLDKNTSGLMVIAKNDVSHQHLSAQFAQRSLYRIYETLIWGIPEPIKGTITGNIQRHAKCRQKMNVVRFGGKEAQTDYKLLQCYHGAISHMECRLHSGRTHQIRLHMHHKGWPVLGDTLYGSVPKKNKTIGFAPLLEFLRDNPGQILHARKLRLIHPTTQQEMEFEANLCEKFHKVLEFLQ